MSTTKSVFCWRISSNLFLKSIRRQSKWDIMETSEANTWIHAPHCNEESKRLWKQPICQVFGELRRHETTRQCLTEKCCFLVDEKQTKTNRVQYNPTMLYFDEKNDACQQPSKAKLRGGRHHCCPRTRQTLIHYLKKSERSKNEDPSLIYLRPGTASSDLEGWFLSATACFNMTRPGLVFVERYIFRDRLQICGIPQIPDQIW